MSGLRHVYLERDAVGLAELVAGGDASASELVEVAIELAEERNPALNAVVATRFDAARAEAAAGPTGRLAGVPFLVKDNNLFVDGLPTGFGSRFGLAAARARGATRESDLVRAWRDAGLVILGATNTPEYAASFTTEPEVYGSARNPHAPALTTGGSSGGAAAAVSSGMVPVAHGNDAGGSIRVPASCCGLFGLKPSVGLSSLQPHFAEGWFGLNAEHVLTRSVRDSAAFLDIAAGVADRPQSGGARRFSDALDGPLPRLRIGASLHNPLYVPPEPDVADAFHDAVRLLELLGHEVVETGPPVGAEAVSAFGLLTMAGVGEMIDLQARSLGRTPDAGELGAAVRRSYEGAARMSAFDLAAARRDRVRVRAAVTEHIRGFDVYLSPVLSRPPWPLGVLTDDFAASDPEGFTRTLVAFAAYTWPFNMSGHPAMSVPLHRTPDGLPIGLQFVADHRADALLLRLARELEEARPWAGRLPVFNA